MRVVDDVGGNENNGTPIIMEALVSYITFENIAAMNNDGNGIAYNLSSAIAPQDIIVNYCNLSYNGNHGFRIPSSLAAIIDLEINNSVFEGNAGAGIMLYNLNSSSNASITNCTLYYNAFDRDVNGEGDVILSSYNWDLFMSDISIVSYECESGVRITGTSSGGGQPADTCTISNITISGTQRVCWAYPSAGFAITRFTDVSDINLSNINLKSIAPNGLFLGTILGVLPPSFNIGNFIFNNTYTIDDITLGGHGGSGTPTNIDIDATQAIFVGAANDIDIENRVWHSVDDGALGTVSWKSP